jgi:DNA-binding response OmpR family regulator
MTETDIKGKRVIVIEDDPLLHALLADKFAVLRDRGVEVVPVTRAEDGLAEAKKAKPDLILLDLILPTMNGFEFLQTLRADPGLAQAPVVVLSNLSAAADKERARSFGVLGYLVKANFSMSEICDIVEKILRGEKVAIDTPDAPLPEGGAKIVYL